MTLWPLALYLALALVVVAAMLIVPQLLGGRHREAATAEPYESGILVTGSGRARLSIQYYLVAMFFVIFDLEAVFLFAWSVAATALGWVAYIEAAIFVGVLLVGLAYLWRSGALDWGPRRSRSRQQASGVGSAPEDPP